MVSESKSCRIRQGAFGLCLRKRGIPAASRSFISIRQFVFFAQILRFQPHSEQSGPHGLGMQPELPGRPERSAYPAVTGFYRLQQNIILHFFARSVLSYGMFFFFIRFTQRFFSSSTLLRAMLASTMASSMTCLNCRTFPGHGAESMFRSDSGER